MSRGANTLKRNLKFPSAYANAYASNCAGKFKIHLDEGKGFRAAKLKVD